MRRAQLRFIEYNAQRDTYGRVKVPGTIAHRGDSEEWGISLLMRENSNFYGVGKGVLLPK
jgi:hypothetical protein